VPPRISDFVFDDENESKLDRHGLTPEQAVEVIRNTDYIVVRNRKGRRARDLVIGRDNAGRCITIPVEPTGYPGWWRPVTAWLCKEAERALLRRQR
jgi:uncharacterized DUF497 family protein